MEKKYIDIQEFRAAMNITYATVATWIKKGIIKDFHKEVMGFGKYKYMIAESEVERIKELRK